MIRILIVIAIVAFLAEAEAEAHKTNYVRSLMEVLPKVDNHSDPLSVCFAYPFEYYSVPSTPVETFNLQNDTGIDLCNNLTDTDFLVQEPNTILLLWASRNCSIRQNVNHIQNGNASGIIIISNSSSLYQINQTYGWKILGVMENSDSKELTKILTEETLKVKFYGLSKFDGSLVVLWLAAIFCVAIGSYSGPRLLYTKTSTSMEHEVLDGASHPEQDESNIVAITVPTILAIVVFICTTLMLLYFFFTYLVYFFIVVFAFSTPRAVYLLTMQLIGTCCAKANIPVWRNYGLIEIVVGLLSISAGIVWIIFRQHFWSWPLQDFLGICFCIHLIQLLQLPNMKIITMLLSLLFIYDIFFVFITPYLTSNGESVMVAVATGGGGSSETIPMLLKCPHFQTGAMRKCSRNEFSMLGFGDIIVPGFLVSFAHCFDLRVGGKYPVYLITSVIAYTIGLAGAFVALLITSTGQPALLYVVPVVLANIFFVGFCRKEVKSLWRGKPDLEVELEAHS